MSRVKTGYIRNVPIKGKGGSPVIGKDGKPATHPYAVWDFIDLHEKPRSKSCKLLTKTEKQREAEAQDFYHAMKAKYTKGVEVEDPKDKTFADFAADYLKEYVVPAVIVKPEEHKAVKTSGMKSHKARAIAVNHLTDYFGKRKKLNSFKRSQIVQYMKTRTDYRMKNGDPLAIATINKEIAALRHMFSIAVELEILDAKEVPSFKKLINKKAETVRKRRLEGNEEERLLTACELPDKQGRFKRLHVKPILIAALDTAMRRGEILQLVWANIDFVKNCITLPAEITKGLEERLIPISDRLSVELEAMYADQNPSPSDKVFRRKVLGRHAGKQVSEPYYVDIVSNFQSSWDSIREDAKVDNLTFHGSRHTATTQMINSGMSEVMVRKITGHKSLDMFDRYNNQNTEELNQEYIKFEAYKSAAQKAKADQSELIN